MPILLIIGFISGFMGGLFGSYMALTHNLPDIPDLRRYKPKTVSKFYAADKTVIGIFYKEKRFPVDIESIPSHVIYAFLAAEDARFFSHPGVDLIGIARAAVSNIKSGSLGEGGSTITQQVIKNLLLTREKKFKRKMKELILAYRLEKSLSKMEILELYLNEIYLGNGAYGVESAARTYFGKITKDLTISEACMLASVVPRPNSYAPTKNYKRALDRRDNVLKAMLENNFINQQQYKNALAEKPKLREKLPNPYQRAPYFTEAVRQYIVDKYGEERLLNEGLTVWTTCDLDLQRKATEALIHGARAWEKRNKRPRGLIERDNHELARRIIEQAPPKDGYKKGDIIKAVVIADHTPKKEKRSDPDPTQRDCEIVTPGNQRLRVKLEGAKPFMPNDIIELMVTEQSKDSITVVHHDLPPVQGALVSIENRTGYVRALVGGTDFAKSRFNRAIQAMRQPGSAFKPFIFAAAFEWAGYSPRTIINDEPIMVLVDNYQEPWVPLNSSGKFLGPVTVYDALIHSKNVPSIKLLMDVGIDRTIQIAKDMGIKSPLGANLSLVLGSSEVTPIELTSAYSVIPNMGIKVAPVLIKKVVDRFGNILEDNTCEPLEISEASLKEATDEGWGPEPVQTPQYENQNGFWFQQNGQWYYQPGPGNQSMAQTPAETEQPEPSQEDEARENELAWERYWGSPSQLQPMGTNIEFLTSGKFPETPPELIRRPDPKRVISPQTSYLMASLMREVCVRGTGGKARKLKRKDIGGKTGTTNDCTDAWFVGFNPKYTTSVWIGHDAKISLGKKEYGSVAALPSWIEFMAEALKDTPDMEYPVPPYIEFWNPNSYQNQYYAYGTYGVQQSGPPAGGKVDLSSEIPKKQYSPLDEMTGYNAGYTNMQPSYNLGTNPNMNANMGAWPGQNLTDEEGNPLYYAGVARALSASGEPLGQAPYYMDEDGNVIAFREDLTSDSSTYWNQAQGYQQPGYNTRGNYVQGTQPPIDPNARAQNQPYQQQGGPFHNILPHAQRFMNNIQRMLPNVNDIKHFEW